MPNPTHVDSAPVDIATVRDWLGDGGEITFLDVREEGEHGAGHPLLAVNLPYSRIEIDAARLVPRRACRVVLIDGGDGVADKAARRLAGLGYSALHVVAGGVPAWEREGHPLFPSTNVPSKAFAELVEIERHTPHVTAEELDRIRREGTKLAVLDSRTVEEFNRFHVPGAVSCPGAELVHRFSDLVPDPDTLVVVSCAGRTRSIIGAQSLLNAGVPNKVVSLQGGTQAWRLQGLELERDTRAVLAPVSSQAAERARRLADDVSRRYGVRRIDRATLDSWLGDSARTTYLLDVRTPEEYAAGHLPGSVSAEGGQLVQAIDRWVGTRGARLVLADDTGTRAIMTAHWLQQMGWDVVVLDEAATRPEAGGPNMPHVPIAGTVGISPAHLPDVPVIGGAEAGHWLNEGDAAAVAIMPSGDYRRGHPEGAVWAIRPRLDRLPDSVRHARRIVVFTDDPVTGALVAADLAEITGNAVALAQGGIEAWHAAGHPLAASPNDPPDAERIDYVFWNHDRHAGNQEAMRAYLRWETELPGEIARDGLAGFKLATG